MCPFVVLYVAAVVVAGYWVGFYGRELIGGLSWHR
jgi:hypothetical protein